MHATTARLYEAAKTLKGISEPSALARAMNISPQVLNNWERRGMSAEGILAAEEALGCESRWLKTGTGSLCAPGVRQALGTYQVNPDTTAIVITSIQAALQLAGLSPDHLGDRDSLSKALKAPAQPRYAETRIREAAAELMAESREILGRLSPTQIAEALMLKLKHWIEMPETAPAERDKLHKY